MISTKELIVRLLVISTTVFIVHVFGESISEKVMSFIVGALCCLFQLLIKRDVSFPIHWLELTAIIALVVLDLFIGVSSGFTFFFLGYFLMRISIRLLYILAS